MTILDLILVFILAFATAAGFFFGLVRVLGAIVTIVLGIMIAGLFFENLAPVLTPYLLGNEDIARVAAFVAIYWVSSLFLTFVVGVVNHLFKLPLLRTVNRLLGAIVSFGGSIIILSVFFFLIDKFAWVAALTDLLNQSSLIRTFVSLGRLVSVLIPGL